jgi:hypothetical protein
MRNMPMIVLPMKLLNSAASADEPLRLAVEIINTRNQAINLATRASSMRLGRVMGSRYGALFWTKECIKWSSPFAVKLSKKEIQRPIQGPLGAV